MKIENSAIFMSSKNTISKSYTKKESLKVWVGNERPDFEGLKSPSKRLKDSLIDAVHLSDQVKELLKGAIASAKTKKADKSGVLQISEKDRIKILLIKKMFEAMTGKKLDFHVLDSLSELENRQYIESGAGLENLVQAVAQAMQAPPPAQESKQGWGLEYDYNESYQEQEKMSFTAAGIIKTADGKEIDFTVQLNMSRQFLSEKNISIRAGDAVKVDPLVVNFDGKAAELTSNKFVFDLDSDGNQDQISFVGPGSGFLALDANGDGVINNGTELFGPNTGDGYAELIKYDEDGNNWIDENDSIYNNLRIWTKDLTGRTLSLPWVKKASARFSSGT